MLTPGVYRLTEDCPAHRLDRRVRNDWRTAPIAAGTLFVVQSNGPDDPTRAYLTIRALHSYAHEAVTLHEARFLDKLTPVTPTASQHLAYLHGRTRSGCAEEILDWLFARGLLTTAGIDRILADIDHATNNTET